MLLRRRLYRKRLLLKEKRQEIKEEESGIVALLDNLRDPTNYSLYAFQELYTKIEVKQNELGALQHDYDQTEAGYDVAEVELEEQEAIETEKIALYSQAIAKQDRAADKEAQSRAQATRESGNSEWQPRYSMNLASSSLPFHQSRRPTKMGEHSNPHGIANIDSKVPGQVEEDYNVKQDDGRRGSDAHGTDDLYTRGESSRAKGLDSLLSFPDKNSGTSRRGKSIQPRSRIDGWLFDTFGSSSEDFLQRAGDKKELSPSGTVDNKTWGRIVRNHWFRRPVLLATPATPPGTQAAASIHNNLRHRDESIDGSHLHLPSVSSKIKPSIDDVNRLFSLAPYSSATSQMNDDFISRMHDESDSCLGRDEEKLDQADSVR